MSGKVLRYSVIKEIAERYGREWVGINDAVALSQDNRRLIIKTFGSRKIFNSESDLVVFGSIARDECTMSSDVDWTLLVDGQANPSHLSLAHLIEGNILSTGLTEPGSSGMFGQISFSHDLINYIGGEDDTNHNLSRRMLLLLESEKINVNDEKTIVGTAHDRVIRGIIQQYIDCDSGYNVTTGKGNIPRFFLNDLIRFWRTMCVDFAYKQREQKGKKWALRNVKLRMSRKLIFIKGLLICHKLFAKGEIGRDEVKAQLREFAAKRPLDFMVESFLENGVSIEIIIAILDSYDSYLSMLNDSDKRLNLATMDMNSVYGDPSFDAAREISRQFQDQLNKVFIQDSGSIREFTLKYGIF